MARRIEIASAGTVEISDATGELRVFNSQGQMIASVRPDGHLWFYIAEKALAQIRTRIQGE